MGPCLCGDPYCGSCGNPGLAALEDAADEINEEVNKALSVGVRPDVILAVVKALREGVERDAADVEEARKVAEAEADFAKQEAEFYASLPPDSAA
jgi:hypothetical protein